MHFEHFDDIQLTAEIKSALRMLVQSSLSTGKLDEDPQDRNNFIEFMGFMLMLHAHVLQKYNLSQITSVTEISVQAGQERITAYELLNHAIISKFVDSLSVVKKDGKGNYLNQEDKDLLNIIALQHISGTQFNFTHPASEEQYSLITHNNFNANILLASLIRISAYLKSSYFGDTRFIEKMFNGSDIFHLAIANFITKIDYTVKILQKRVQTDSKIPEASLVEV